MQPKDLVSRRMASIRTSNTAAERLVRRQIHRLGQHYRICPARLPGKPDLANCSKKWCVLVHGCFWHGHGNCRKGRLPKVNTRFWVRKICRNRERDKEVLVALRTLGFRVLTVWECELRRPEKLNEKLQRFFLGEQYR